MHASECVFCFIYYNCIIILLCVTVFVCHDEDNVFCTINSPVYVYWKQVKYDVVMASSDSTSSWMRCIT